MNKAKLWMTSTAHGLWPSWWLRCAPLRQWRLSTLFLAMCLLSPALYADSLGRLFFTPEQRTFMDHQRAASQADGQFSPDANALTINGLLIKSTGQYSIWVNDTLQDNAVTPMGFSLRPHAARSRLKNKEKILPPLQRVVLRSKEITTTQLLVGATFYAATGEAADLLDGGHIRIHLASQKNQQTQAKNPPKKQLKNRLAEP